MTAPKPAIIVASPMAGWVSPLGTVPDPVFAEQMLGDGLAIDPIEGTVRAPVAGTIISAHAALHAVTIAADGGAILLVHVGLETVALGGAGFTAHVRAGDRVAVGDVLVMFDLDTVGRRAKSLVTPVILTNGEAFAIEAQAGEGMIAAGAPLFALVPREAVVDAVETGGAVVDRAVIVPLRHGIHARPAARLAEQAKGFVARLELIAEDGRSAALASPVAVLALALGHGARVTLRGAGPGAEAAVAALAETIESGMGEGAAIIETPAEAEVAGPLPPMLRGVAAAPGAAIGRAWSLPRAAADLKDTAEDAEAERRALADARDRVRADLQASERDGGVGAAIAAAHLAFLDDPELIDHAAHQIAAGRSAAFAWRASIARIVAALSAASDARFAERADDLSDLGARVERALAGESEALAPPEGAILIGVDVLPSQLMALGGKGLAGIAAGQGGPTSHAAIIAAGLGLPMVVALGPDVARIAPGTVLLVDGEAGTLAIDPPAAAIADARTGAAREAAFRAAAETRAHEPAVTRDGVAIEVFANLGSLADAEAAVRAGAEGCGLLRTELVFLDRATPPGEEEQHALYQAIADALQGRPLIVRTLDIGADKPVPWLPMAAEDNPALGLRGVRIGLARRDLLATQLRALLRVTGDVRVMLPMIVDAGELIEVRALLAGEAAALGVEPPPLGVMVETPAAALLAGSLAHDAAFLSIGSNDLTQYALAMDRGNPAVAGRLDGLHPAVLRLIAQTVAGGDAHDRWTGVCGGIAADPLAVPLLVGLGVTELSVPPTAVAAIKAYVRETDRTAARALAARALDAPDAAAVRALARAALTERALA